MEARHPLFGAELRAKRAKVPIRSIRRHLHRWADLHWEYVELVLDEEGKAQMDEHGNVPYKMKGEVPVEILGRTSVWIGEAVYNLRSALDYLVYAAAHVGHGKPVSGTQFPIEDDMGVFDGRVTGTNPNTGQKVTRYLRHVPPNAVERIRRLQPCWDPPCEWTALLRDLSNPDKHRYLTELRSRGHVVAGFHPLLSELAADDETRTHPTFVVEVFFRETDHDVVDTLEMLQGQVEGLVNEFKEAFGVTRKAGSL